MHRPMLRALKHKPRDMGHVVNSQMHRPMLRALKLQAALLGKRNTGQMHRPMLRALKLESSLAAKSAVLSYASPDIEGIETPYLLIPQRTIQFVKLA